MHPVLEDVDLVVFDKDGTLISFEATWSAWARELGARLELATRRPIAGDVFATIGFDPTVNRIQPNGLLASGTMGEIHELVGAILRRWCPSVSAARRILADVWFEPDPVADIVPLFDVAVLVAALDRSGRRVAIATTDDRIPTEATIGALGVATLVGAVLCGDDDGPRKPDPAVLVGLADRFGVAAARTAMVGDTPGDLRMARAAGAVSIGVASGVTPAAELAPLAHLVLASAAELLITPLNIEVRAGPGERT